MVYFFTYHLFIVELEFLCWNYRLFIVCKLWNKSLVYPEILYVFSQCLSQMSHRHSDWEKEIITVPPLWLRNQEKVLKDLWAPSYLENMELNEMHTHGMNTSLLYKPYYCASAMGTLFNILMCPDLYSNWLMFSCAYLQGKWLMAGAGLVASDYCCSFCIQKSLDWLKKKVKLAFCLPEIWKHEM